MLNKLQFNNLVISNKKGIQQSRLQTINKLVHKIRKLKILLEKRPENVKCKERIRKSSETLELLKKYKRVDIMKNVLLLDKPPAAVITNGLSTPEDISIALLAMNKVMSGLIKRFKLELVLEDVANASWKMELQESSKRRQKIQRTEEKRKKRIELKTQKQMAHKRQEWLEENNPNAAESNEPTIVSTVGVWEVEDIEMDHDGKPADIAKNKDEVQNLKLSVKSIESKKKLTMKTKPDRESNVKAGEKSPQNKIETVNIKTNIEKKNSDKRNKHENIADFRDDEDNDAELEETHVVDPFFITDTGENYLSSAVAKDNDKWDSGREQEEKRDLHLIKLNGRKKPSVQQDLRPKFPNKNKFPSQRYDKPNKFATENKFTKQQSTKASESKGNMQNIHPSWAAKQKLKPIISSFQGKKITFDDDNATAVPAITSTNKSYTNKKNELSNNESNLHPSWLAKQKLKPTITAFKGKKITFDNDNE